MERASRGISLIELLIMVVMVSVVATAFLSSRLRSSESQIDAFAPDAADNGTRSALDEIAYHIRFANYGPPQQGEPFSVQHLGDTDRIEVTHNELCLVYFVDEAGNLIRKVGDIKKVLVTNVTSLKLLRMGKETIILTISTIPDQEQEPESDVSLSRSYSTVVRAGGQS